MANRQTLILLSPGFPVNEADTTCLPAHQVFVRALQKNYPSLNIIVLAFQYPFVAGEYTWNGIKIISFNGQNKPGLHRLHLWYKVWRKLQRLCKTYAVTGLLSFWAGECAVVGKYFGKKYNIPHYSWITGQDAKPGNALIKLLRPKAKEIFAMSYFLSQQFYKNYGIKPFAVIPNGIDTALFAEGEKRRNIDLLAAGSLIPLKQYDVFIDVVKLIHNELPQATAMLCGKGPEEQQLKNKIEQLNLSATITFAGEKQHREVLALMQQCRIFLHTSNYEGFSTVCLEALYAGAHVISFFKPMEHDIEHWHIVDTKEAMAAKVLELLLNPVTQYTPVLAYSMDDIAKQVMQLYSI